MKIQPILFFILVVFTFSLILPITVNAQTFQEQREEAQQNREDLQEDVEQRVEDIQNLWNERVETRCSIVTTRVDSITARYSDNQLRYVNRYNNLIERLDNLVATLNERDVDPLDLPELLTEMQGLVDQFNSEMNETISILNESKELACGESEGAYREKIQEARIALLDARSTGIEINNFFLITISDELEEIKEAN